MMGFTDRGNSGVEQRLDRIVTAIESLVDIAGTQTEILKGHRERLDAVERQTAYTQRIWVAVAKKMELWDELEEDGLAPA